MAVLATSLATMPVLKVHRVSACKTECGASSLAPGSEAKSPGDAKNLAPGQQAEQPPTANTAGKEALKAGIIGPSGKK
jgi:hypothetical protein